MKKIRIVGLAFAALFLGVNFIACEDEYDNEAINDGHTSESVTEEDEEDTILLKKRLTEMRVVKNNLTNDSNFTQTSTTYKFSYDEMDRLILTEILNSEGVTTSAETYCWEENTIVCQIKEEGVEIELITFQLDSNLINFLNRKYKYGERYYEKEYSFTYDSINHLVKIKYDSKDSSTYKWRNNKIQEKLYEDSFDGQRISYTYGDELINGYLPMFEVTTSLSYIHPELFGVKTNTLLTKENLQLIGVPGYGSTEYFYVLDEEGYVESYTEKTIFYFGCHDDTPSIYGYTTHLKWE